MGRRSWYCYNKIDRPPYTRKKYIRGGPEPMIKMFEMGNSGGEFDLVLTLNVQERGQLSHNSLEAARIQVNKYLMQNIEDERKGYHLKICVYPHHIIRENKMMTGAGADRVQDGMRHAWGKPVGSAARVERGKEIIKIRCHPNDYEIAKEALRRGKYKFPMPSKIRIKKGKEKIIR